MSTRSLKLLVYAALRYVISSSFVYRISTRSLKLLVYEALRYWCMRPYAMSYRHVLYTALAPGALSY
jgi:hypothetical protein